MKILITRPRKQADAFAAGLQAVGFEPQFFPVIEIRPMVDNSALDAALAHLERYDWLIFTSVNGVAAVWSEMERRGLRGLPGNLKVAAIGPKTAQALQSHGVQVNFVPDEYVAEAILPGLGDLHGRWVLLLRAEISRKTLPEAISQAGGVAHEIAVYQTVPAKIDQPGLAALKHGVDVVTLTSPSTAQNFCFLARQHGLDPHHLPGSPVFACIGPITHRAAQEEGLSPLVVAEEYTTEGLTRAIRAIPTR